MRLGMSIPRGLLGHRNCPVGLTEGEKAAAVDYRNCERGRRAAAGWGGVYSGR